MTEPKLRPILPALATLGAHALALRNGYVLDDRTLVVANPFVHDFAGLRVMLRSS